jgi:hypothetical protein
MPPSRPMCSRKAEDLKAKADALEAEVMALTLAKV